MIRPLRDNVVIRQLAADSISEGGIFLPEAAQEQSQRGVVVAAGDAASGLEEGAEVIFRPHLAMEIKVDGEELLLTSAEYVLAVVL